MKKRVHTRKATDGLEDMVEGISGMLVKVWDDVDLNDTAYLSYGHWNKLTDNDFLEPTTVLVPDYLSGSDYSGGTAYRSNYNVFLEEFGDLPGVYDISGGHGTYAIGIRLDSLNDDMLDILHGLEDYPVIDEEAMSELETEQEDEAWENWTRSEFTRALTQKFPDLEEEIEDLSNDQLFELFRESADKANEYWEHDAEGARINVKRIVETIDEEDIPEPGVETTSTVEDPRQLKFPFRNATTIYGSRVRRTPLSKEWTRAFTTEAAQKRQEDREAGIGPQRGRETAEGMGSPGWGKHRPIPSRRRR